MKKEIYFITATNTDVGKSYASEVFLKKLSNDKIKVGYFKPIETGVIDTPADGSKLLNIAKELNPNFKVDLDNVVPYKFPLAAAPFIAKENTNIDIEYILKKATYLLKFCDTLIVEGAGGLMVPIDIDFFMIDLIKIFQKKFNAKVILISPSNLGSINDTLLSQNTLKQKDIKYEWYINLFKDKDSFNSVTLPFYKEYFDKISFL
ncbi:MAG: dethiobiotin synthase [Campylobacterota bacterium]|nr:dethiobiotin synthase [Campylobacterota bacterium]